MVKETTIQAHPLALGLAKMNGTGGAILAYLTGANWQYFASAQDLLLIRPISRTFVTDKEILALGSLLPKQDWSKVRKVRAKKSRIS